MTIRLDNSVRNAIVDAITAQLGSGTVNIYTGSQPADPNSAASGSLLASITISGGMSSASNGTSSLSSAPETATASANGTAGWARLVSGGYNIDGSVATSGGDFTINTLSIVSGGAISLTAFSINQAAS